MTHKKLNLSKEHRVLTGVCGGLAEYFETDPVLIRLVFIFFTILGGAGVVLYLVLWFFMSEKKDLHFAEDEMKSTVHNPRRHNQGVIGFFLIIIGSLILLDNILPGFGIKTFWPLILILAGLAIMLPKHR